MWMIESESADFHSWLQKTATSNTAEITFMLSSDMFPPQRQKKKKKPTGAEKNHSSLSERANRV